MKVRLTQEAKKYITVAEMPAVRRIIADMKEDTSTVEDYAEMAINAAYDGRAYNIGIFKATAEIAKNQRVYNAYGENSDSLDVWITAVAYVNCDEFIELGVYLSDIWQITCDNKREIASHMYVRRFKEVK